MTRSKESIREAEEYLATAEDSYQRILQEEDRPLNPVLVNCIMAMIKTNDALMLEKRGHENTDHSQTAQELKEMYEEGLISENFKSNVDSIRRWVVDNKTAVQYQNKQVSQRDAEAAIKAAKRFLAKARRELGPI